MPPSKDALESIAVGTEAWQEQIGRFLATVSGSGGAVNVVRGAYGHGKSFSLGILREIALRQGFLVVSTEIDASENQLHKPHHVYGALMRNLLVPGGTGGVRALAERLARLLTERHQRTLYPEYVQRWLEQELDCPPLAWLLSDSRITRHADLLGLWSATPGCSAARVRRLHVLPGDSRDWPNFTAGTQGDFASFILCGLGRLSRLLGFNGLIVILDEMEKWQNLDWRAQTQAGNLIGGLIWGSTAPEEWRFRSTYQHPNRRQPEALQHSGRSGGYPFTTSHRCSLGLVIAMTPRSEYESPETAWRQFGEFDIFDLSTFTTAHLRRYADLIAQRYVEAYDLPEPDQESIFTRARTDWIATGDDSVRLAGQAIVGALDSWRESLHE